MFVENLRAYVADFGVPVIFGNLTTTALFDQPDADVLGARAQSTAYRITYPATDLVGLNHGDQLLIGNQPGWGFDSTGRRLRYLNGGPIPDGIGPGTFQVLGSPNKVRADGAFMQADLQAMSS